MNPLLGIAFVPTLPPAVLRPLSVAAEESGLDELWVWEDCFKESAIASAAFALAATERIGVGIGLMPTPLRTVALAAMELATLEEVAPGRLIGGIGHGVLDWMGQAGVRVASPLTLLREYAVALRALLDGERVSVSGRYVTLDDVALDWPPHRHLPLLIGAGGPKGVRVAGELSDGLIVAGGRSPDDLVEAVAWAREGGAADDAPVVASLIVATGDDGEKRADRDLQLFNPGEHPGATAWGEPQRIADAVLALAEAGATSVVIQPTGDEPDVLALVRHIGAEVAPLVRSAG